MSRLGEPPYICLITPGRANASNYTSEKRSILHTISEAVEDGIRLIQIREKLLPARDMFDLARETVRAFEGRGVLVFVNERADIAVAAGAAGVHLPEAAIPPDVIRGTFGSEILVGVSTHSRESAFAASQAGADYVFFGPVFATPGKREVGVEKLAEVCHDLAPVPVLAIGGIDETNIAECLKSGAAGIAAIRALNDSTPRRAMMRTLGG